MLENQKILLIKYMQIEWEMVMKNLEMVEEIEEWD